MALKQVEWIDDQELLLRGVPFSAKPEKRYVDKGTLTSMVFADRIEKGGCPSVHRGKSANFEALVQEEPTRFGFAVLLTSDVRTNQLGEVIHNPTEHDSHAVIVPSSLVDSSNKRKSWRRSLIKLVWDFIFIPERVEQFR
jgi:hypothetical protein